MRPLVLCLLMIAWFIPTNASDRLSAVYDREVVSRNAFTLHKVIENGCEVTFVAEHFPYFGPSLPGDLPNNSNPEAQSLNTTQVVVIKTIWPPDWIEQNEETFIERLNSDPGEEPKLGIKKTTDFDALLPYWHRLREQLTERGVTAQTDTHQRLILSSAISREMKRPEFQCEVQHPSTGVIPVG